MSDLNIQQKWEDMAQYAYVALRHIPKSERFSLGSELRQCIWKGLRLIVMANSSRDKRRLLFELDAELKTLQALVRTAQSIEILPYQKYKIWSGLLVEIGCMLGGWIKHCK